MILTESRTLQRASEDTSSAMEAGVVWVETATAPAMRRNFASCCGRGRPALSFRHEALDRILDPSFLHSLSISGNVILLRGHERQHS